MTTENQDQAQDTQLARAPGPLEARVNITFAGQNGELPDPVPYDANEEQIRGWVTEALRTGGVPGITRDEAADISNYVVEKFDAVESMPLNRISVRPKTGYGF